MLNLKNGNHVTLEVKTFLRLTNINLSQTKLSSAHIDFGLK